MEYLTIIGLALGLSMDATAVSAVAGWMASPIKWRPGIRLAFHFGLFQALLPIVGWAGGKKVQSSIAAFDHWLAFLLLVCVGSKMIWDSHHQEKGGMMEDMSRGISLVFLSFAVSIDALAVGLSLSLINSPIIIPVLVFGMVTFGMSLIGYRLGATLGASGSRYLKGIGGIILIAIGIKIVISHIL